MGYFVFNGKNGKVAAASPDFAGELPRGCATVLAPFGKAAAAGSFVSYGLPGRSTLSFSSIGVEELVISVSREMVDAEGRLIDRQEIPVRRQAGASLEETLWLAGTLLILGTPPEKLSELL